MPRAFPRLRALAEQGLLVEFGDSLTAAVQQSVIAFDQALAAAPPAGFCEAVPTGTSVMLRFDPLKTDHDALGQSVQHLLKQQARALPATSGEAPPLHEVEICYEGDCAPDLAEMAKLTGLSPEAVVAAHLAGDYQVLFYGFAPGYAYLSGVPEALHLPRKTAAVRDLPAGSLLVAGAQCIVSTLKMPTGWWVIGRSPTQVLTGRAERPFLFEPGDRARFRRISRAALGAR